MRTFSLLGIEAIWIEALTIFESETEFTVKTSSSLNIVAIAEGGNFLAAQLAWKVSIHANKACSRINNIWNLTIG